MPGARLVATDMDGTLLGPAGTLTRRTLDALRAATDAGVTVVAATGRSHRTALPRLAGDDTIRHVVCSNGATLYDRTADAVVDHRPVRDAALVPLVRALRDALPGVVFGWESPSGFVWERDFHRMRPATDGNSERLEAAIEDTWDDGTPTEAVTKLLVGHPRLQRDALLAEVAPVLVDGVVATNSGALFVEVTGAGVDKASGLARLCERLGVDASDVVAVGDNLNDLAMFAWAGRAVAMAGGHPAAVAAADEIAPGCADDGVAWVLDALVADPTPG